jgi:hypothetical protein
MKLKIKIKWANTATLQVIFGSNLDYPQRCALYDYIDELRQQAKWNTEKCQRES